MKRTKAKLHRTGKLLDGLALNHGLGSDLRDLELRIPSLGLGV